MVKISALFLALAALGSASFPMAEARKVSTRVTAPPRDPEEMTAPLRTYPRHISEFDKVSQSLTFMAYDKKASADKETFFVDNGSSVALSALEIEISYFNTEGKQIHRRSVELRQEFPAKETRRVDIASWDLQKSFHYINSVPSSKGSSPYTVRFKVLSFIPS